MTDLQPAYIGDEPFVFVCYAHKDKDLVYRDIAWLQNQGINVWFDQGISAGSIWRAEIGEAIQACSHVLFFVSESSLESAHCNREIHLALDEDKPFLPVYLEDIQLTTDLRVGLARVQAIHREESDAYRQQLTGVLNSEQTPSHRQNIATTSRPAQRRPLGLGLAALAVVLVAVIGLFYANRTGEESPDPAIASDSQTVIPLAIMPFDDLSPDGDQAWLASGITESLMDSLNRIQGISVAGIQSAGLLQNQGADLAEIGESLDVDSVVYGSVQHAGEDLRVLVRWLNVEDESTLWSARFERQFDDVFDVQREISAGIAEAIRQELGVDQPLFRSMEAARYEIEDVRLWELLRRSRELRASAPRDPVAHLEARELCQQAVQIDPDFAPGYGCLSINYLGSETVPGDQAAALEYAKQALEIDPLNLDAQTTIASIEEFTLRLFTAEQRIRALVSLYPANGSLRARYTSLLQSLGRFDEAIDQARRAASLEPLLSNTRASLGQALLIVGRDLEAIEHLEHAMSLNEPNRNTWALLSIAYMRVGREDDALEATILQYPLSMDREIFNQIVATLRQGFAEDGMRGAHRAVGQGSLDNGFCSAYNFSLIGDREQFFECFEQSIARGRIGQWRLVASASLSTFRDDARYQEVIEERFQQIREAEEQGPIVPLPQVNEIAP